MRFPCPVCGAERRSHQAPCTSCSWAPRPVSPSTAGSEDAWKANQQRGRWSAALALAGAVILAVALVGAWRHSRRVGALCADDFDCNTHMCLFVPVLGASGERGMCTQPCSDDAGCPDQMVCDKVGREGKVTKRSKRRACTPTGERLSELLDR